MLIFLQSFLNDIFTSIFECQVFPPPIRKTKMYVLTRCNIFFQLWRRQKLLPNERGGAPSWSEVKICGLGKVLWYMKTFGRGWSASLNLPIYVCKFCSFMYHVNILTMPALLERNPADWYENQPNISKFHWSPWRSSLLKSCTPGS